MDCQQCRDLVSASLDGEASGAERAARDEHLARCADCRAFAGAAERITRLARVRPAEPVPDVATLLASIGLDAGVAPARESERPVLTSVPGCCGTGTGTVAVLATAGAACGCSASCGCGCQQGSPCRCGTRAA
ncbi:zf-HC2 domain-containing protein [Pseudonocardia nematodicida]|uniref:Zf-HC2 domain-containing protein n=1 Tax=Pseudonocardia nematodicida TaxID=1206997 RepID=A0ABV1KIK4_9PSEU